MLWGKEKGTGWTGLRAGAAASRYLRSQWFCCTWLSGPRPEDWTQAVQCSEVSGRRLGWAERYRKRVCSRACTMGTTVLLTVKAVCWLMISLTEL